MGEVEDLVSAARQRFDEVVRRAVALLGTQADPDRVHRRYLSAAVDLAEEVQVRALLAVEGDASALERLRLVVSELESLGGEALAELRPQAGE